MDREVIDHRGPGFATLAREVLDGNHAGGVVAALNVLASADRTVEQMMSS